MDGAGNPAFSRLLIATSSGHGACPADVIIAMTLCPAGRLKAAPSEMTNAGRFFSACRSVNGNGTRTTSNCSKLAIGLLVFGGMPFAQRALYRLQVLDVGRLDPSHGNTPIRLDFPCKQIARLARERGPDFLRDGGLAFGSDLR